MVQQLIIIQMDIVVHKINTGMLKKNYVKIYQILIVRNQMMVLFVKNVILVNHHKVM